MFRKSPDRPSTPKRANISSKMTLKSTPEPLKHHQNIKQKSDAKKTRKKLGNLSQSDDLGGHCWSHLDYCFVWGRVFSATWSSEPSQGYPPDGFGAILVTFWPPKAPKMDPPRSILGEFYMISWWFSWCSAVFLSCFLVSLFLSFVVAFLSRETSTSYLLPFLASYLFTFLPTSLLSFLLFLSFVPSFRISEPQGRGCT